MITPGIGYTITNSTKGFSLEIEQQANFIETPFKVYEDTDSEGTAVIRIAPGTINNQLPTVAGVEIGGAEAFLPKPGGSGFICLTIPASSNDNDSFPSNVPEVTFNSTVPSQSQSSAYVALAKLEMITAPGSDTPTLTIKQLVSGSLWGERFECGSQLDYWFSQI